MYFNRLDGMGLFQMTGGLVYFNRLNSMGCFN